MKQEIDDTFFSYLLIQLLPDTRHVYYWLGAYWATISTIRDNENEFRFLNGKDEQISKVVFWNIDVYFSCFNISLRQSECIVCPHRRTVVSFSESKRYCIKSPTIRHHFRNLKHGIITDLVTDRTVVSHWVLHTWMLVEQAIRVAGSYITYRQRIWYCRNLFLLMNTGITSKLSQMKCVLMLKTWKKSQWIELWMKLFLICSSVSYVTYLKNDLVTLSKNKFIQQSLIAWNTQSDMSILLCILDPLYLIGIVTSFYMTYCPSNRCSKQFFSVLSDYWTNK